MRILVFHYHIFKNAGTSIDEILRQNFGKDWSEAEFSTPSKGSNMHEVVAHLKLYPNLLAFSSHTAYLPTPKLENCYVFPIIFVRHPIDRLKSAYVFERAQNVETFGAQLAKVTDFSGYIRELIRHPENRQARNFQTLILARNELDQDGAELKRALKATNNLPFVGLVELFDQSLVKLQRSLKPFVPLFRTFSIKKNVTRSANKTLSDRLVEIRNEIGSTLFDESCEANADDIKVFEEVKKRYTKMRDGDDVNR